jgi:hypothetical protein
MKNIYDERTVTAGTGTDAGERDLRERKSDRRDARWVGEGKREGHVDESRTEA